MSNITPFDFDGHPIRVVTDGNDEAWFSANEVCEVLGFGNPRQALGTHADEDDVQKMDTIDNLGRRQPANHVNESGRPRAWGRYSKGRFDRFAGGSRYRKNFRAPLQEPVAPSSGSRRAPR